MSQSFQIKIVTVYDASYSPKTRNNTRLIALFALAVSIAWLWGMHQKADPWLRGKIMIAGIGQLGALLPTEQTTRTALTADQRTELLAKQDQLEQQFAVLTLTRLVWRTMAYVSGGWLALAGIAGLIGRAGSRTTRRTLPLIIIAAIIAAAGLTAAVYLNPDTKHLGWIERFNRHIEWIDYTAIGWLAVAGIIGMTYWGALRMLKQAALWMLLSTAITVGGVWTAIHFGGMPPVANETLAKLAAIQAAAPLIILITTRFAKT
jgi:hypothetical protein